MAELPRKRKAETVRDRAQKEATAPKKQRRIRSTASTLAKPVHSARRIGKKEYYLPMPDNKVGRFMNKRRSFIPKYFRNAWKEVRQVTWPGRKETFQLTVAVFMFAIVFAFMVTVVDYGLDKVFKRILLK